MAFHRNNNNSNGRYNNNRQHFRPRHNNQHQQQGHNGQRRHVNRINHVFESTGPDGRVRGTAQQLVEKYSSAARDAQASGDTVLMLNCYQHAEHYQRIYNEILDENSVYEREREQQRAQYQAQQAPDGDNAAPRGDNQPYAGDMGRDDQPVLADQADAPAQPQQPQPAAPRQPRAPRAERSDNTEDAGAVSTGGRVMGRRPSGNRGEQPGANQLRDDDMPSFLKKDIPIKASAPEADAPAGDAGPATAFGRARRAPATRRTAAAAPTDDSASDA